MHHRFSRCAALLLVLCLGFVLAGCGASSSSSSAPEEPEPVYPLSIQGTEIIVGETPVQALLDAGFDVTWSERDANNQITQHTVDPTEQLDAMSYYTGASIWINEHVFAHVSFVTDEESVPLGQATIARVEISFSYSYDDANEDADVVFNGVPAIELTREKAGETFPDFTGDDGMWFSTGLRHYKYGVYYSSGKLNSISAECIYDVDWNGDGR